MASAIELTVTSSIGLECIVMSGADVVLADIDPPGFATTVLRLAEDRPEGIGMVVLVDNPDPLWTRHALSAGVNAILSRDVTKDELHLALEAAEAGFVLLHPSAAPGIFPSDFKRSRNIRSRNIRSRNMDEPIDQLTEREREVLRLISDGLGNREIAQKLKISGHTAKFHVSSILSKLGAASRAEAVSHGIRRGLIVI